MDYDTEYWSNQITLAKKNQKTFHQRGRRVNDRFLAEQQESQADPQKGNDARVFNLFWANIGILKAALYGNPPQPQVERLFQDPNDDIARVAAEIIRRLLITDDIKVAFEHAVEDRLIPGMGQVWLRYAADVVEVPVDGVGVQMIRDEQVPADYVHWQDFFWGPCRVWEECPWVARRVWMTKEAYAKRFPGKSEPKFIIPKEGAVYEASRTEGRDESLKRAEVFEIWCKTTKMVHWITTEGTEMLDQRPDPLKLKDFFPCPRPLIATTTTMKMMPRADFSLVQDQYEQLDELNIRIGYLINACKVVGVYDKNAGAVIRMLQEGVENQLIPVDNWAMFAEKGGIKGVVDWLPIEQIATVIQQLRETRIDVVQQIYELTGISDIMRGVTNARETYGAQKLKAQYSSSRLQLYQGQVAEFVSNVCQLRAEIISRHWQPQSIIAKSQIMLTPDAEHAQQAVALIKNAYVLAYRVRVSSTQMSIPDYNAEKQDRLEFVTALGQFISQVTQLVEKVPEAGVFFLQIVQWAAASFQTTGGVETLFDNYIKAVQKKLMTPPPPKPPTPQDMKDKAAAEKAHAEAQFKTIDTARLLMELGANPALAPMVPTPGPSVQSVPPSNLGPMSAAPTPQRPQ